MSLANAMDFPSKSVDTYRRAEGLGETLAMSNLAQKLIKAGFLKEADEISSAMLGFGLPTLGRPPETDRYHIKYSGEICGHAIKCNVSRHDVAEMAPMTLLGQMANQKQALMIASDTLREIRVYEKDSAEKGKFCELTSLD